MEIKIKEPVTGDEIRLDAQPEDYNGVEGWRILYPDKDSFVMIQQNGDWKVVDEEDMNPEITEAIGKALEPHDRYTSMT